MNPERPLNQRVVARYVQARSYSLKRDIRSKKGAEILRGAKVTLSWENPIATRITDDAGSVVAVRTENLYKYVSGISRPPSVNMMEKWMYDGVAKSITGKRVEPDGYGPDGAPSWMLAMGII
jgi:hypothetical protein